ncbi:MAG TPA: S8 family serine peptidase, partial [Anaerolineales bacterium]|nr:S8 family serine peptidase [Anaerolineales bacterium]
MSKTIHKQGSFIFWKLLLTLVILFVLTAGYGPGRGAASMSQESYAPHFNFGNGITHKVYAPSGALSTFEGVALWHDYGTYALYRVNDAALAQLSPAERARLIFADEANLVIAGREISVQAITDTNLETTEVDGPALQLVQFVGPIKDEWLTAVDTVGARPVHYIATNGYLLWADAPARSELAKMVEAGDFLEYSALYPQALKIGPVIEKRTDPDQVVQVVIQMYRHAGSGASETAIQNVAVNLLSSWTPILEFQNIYAEMRVGDVAEITGLPDVFWVEERMERQLLDEVQGQILAGNLDASQSGPSSPGYLAWLNSYGFSTNQADYPIVDITDDGIGNGTVNSGDPTLHESGDLASPTRLAYIGNCTNSASGEGVDGHGHINASIAGGYDQRGGFPFMDPLGYLRGLGINPYGRFAGTRIFDPSFDLSSCGGTDSGLIQRIQDSGAQISSNSWGCSGCAGNYDDSSQAFDAGVRDADPGEPGNQELIFIFSAGNSGPSSGTVGTPGNGKNMITVGASENKRPSDEDGAWTDGCNVGPTGADNAMDVINFSSRGPSPGSRVKPEVIAPGTHIQGTASTNAGYTGNSVCDQYRPSGQTVFASSSGTSHSTPAVSGVASLAYWWMENTYATTPSPALMKAYLIAHPTYLTGVSANDTLPSNSQGYGMPNMSLMFDDAAKYLLNQEVIFDNSGEVWTWEGAVADSTKPVRIVLAYTDAPGAIGTSPQVNNLDLAASVGGSAYLGNVFSGQWSITGGSADPFNNYEAIFLPAGTDGAIEITVTGFNIAGDGVPNSGDGTDQDFALVCYNCAQTPTFSLNVTPSSLDVCAPAEAVYNVAVGSILGYLDPVSLSASGEPAGTTVGFSVNPVIPPGNSTMSIGNTGSAAAGSYTIAVSGTSTIGTKSQNVTLNLFTAAPASPALLTPADSALGVSFKPTFSWTAVAQASSYLLEVATDAGFTTIVYSTSETGTSHTTPIPLSADTIYFWRVTAGNVCGIGVSTTFSFTTQAATMVCNGATVDFEDGIPADWTVVNNSPGGIVWTTTADPACEIPNRTNGTGEAACADSDAAGSGAPPYDTELVSNPFDLSAYGAAVLDVKAYYNDITTNGNDRFEVDVWDGVGWTNELSWDEDHLPEDFALNLSAYAGLPVVQVRFRYFGNGFDWYAQVDDIALTCVAVGPPLIEVDPAALTAAQGPDIVSTQPMTITNSGGSPLNWNIVEDDTACDSPIDIPWLSVAPNAGATLPLDSTIVDVSFDSAGLVPGGYTANLCVTSDDGTNPLVQVPVTLTVLPPELLVCNGAMIQFEQGIPPGWNVVDNTGGTGIVWVTTADPACEIPNRTNGTGEAACADSDAAGSPAVPYDTELWTPLIDLSGYGAVVLDVKAYYRDITTNANDRFEVDVWDGVSWTNELSWDEDHEPEDFTLNLSSYAGMPGVRVRFRYFGNGFDWYAQVDDIALTCVAVSPPVIEVNPAELNAEQGPDILSTQQINLSNSGGSLLNWSIGEDDSACDSLTDVPWLSATPSSGTTAPLASSMIDVSFDSTGLAPGEYSANLCVESDSPGTEMVQVPIRLTVLPPFALTCNGEVAGFETGIPSGWQVIDNEGFGVVWTTIAGSGETGNYTGGAGDAATASSDRAGAKPFNTELRTASFDLSGWLPSDEIYLTYLANYQNFAAYDYLDVDISLDGGAIWTNLLRWHEDHGGFRRTPGEAVSIDLTPFAGMSGLKLRWHYYDPRTGNDYDWYAQIDDAGLSCIPNPIIDVDPASLSSSQVPSQVVAQDLNINNLGTGQLDWTIYEEGPTATILQPPVLDSPDARTAPEAVGFSSALHVPQPEAILLNEGFEDRAVPPPDWTHVANNPNQTWKLYTVRPHTGASAANVVYDPALIPQDEWLLSPEMTLTEGTLSFWSFGSLYWCRDTYDNCDLNIWIVVGEVGGGDDIFVGKADGSWTSSYTWSQSVFNLTALLPIGPVRIGFQYAGLDGAQIALDDILLDGTAGGPCTAPSDVPWLSVSPDAGSTTPGGSTPVNVSTDATGLVPGLYTANLCVSSNDPATPLVVVPVEMTVNNVPPEAAIDRESQWAQYSDEIAPLTITAVDNIAEALSAETSWSSDGATFNPGLPDLLALSAPSCVDSGGGMQTCTWMVTGPIDLPEGQYTIRTTVSDNYGGDSIVDSEINDLPEDALVSFDDFNPVTVPVAEPGGNSGPFSQTIYVVEKQPDLPADPAGSGSPGDIERANVSMTLVPVGPGPNQGPITCSSAVVPGGYAGEMTVVCEFGNVPVNTYLVQVIVGGGYYSATGESVLVVYDPSLGFTTGGGWFYWPGTTDKTNFGYNLKYNKRGTNVQGNLLLIRHMPDGSIYRVKSNALNGLALGDAG